MLRVSSVISVCEVVNGLGLSRSFFWSDSTRSPTARTRVFSSASAKLFRLDQFQAQGCLIAVDFLHIELAHEVDGLLRNDLARHHDREARGIRDNEFCRDSLAAFDHVIDLLAVEPHMRAVLRVIGEEERCAHVPLVCFAAGIFAECVMKAAEVGKIGNVGNQTLHARVKRRLLLEISREPAIQFARDIRQTP